MPRSPWSRRLAAVSSLGEETRRALFDYIRSAGRPVGRDEAAQAVGLTRGAAAAQLDRLADEGVLAVTFAKAGAGGPGTGRPSKFYSPSRTEFVASVPERNYELVGELMASAAERSMTEGTPIEESLEAAGRREGQKLGREHASIHAVLDVAGYHPVAAPEGFELGNCPFHQLAQGHRGVVCSLSAALLEGALDGCGDAAHRVEPIDPDVGPGECCARIVRAER
ncbi:helix-turn-helix transcriptional regulator [Sinomonas gamaensis]|uniref:helix-turn-helix transcriptional regulator n=1 Tax=Sinomonas gamaensis TaxID=2565624 RepID=UPI001108EDED|nr:transcriptional regulator [Sinomonas gamaensis]